MATPTAPDGRAQLPPVQSIQMVDLKTQYEQMQEEVDGAILDVVRSGAFINGPAVKQFQAGLEEFLGSAHVIPCANGTDALQIALMALDLQPGDEVIVPAFTYVASAEVIALLGLSPVMVDVDPFTFNVTAAQIEPAITARTKAIIPVHLFGQSCDMEPIVALAKQHGLHIVEDNAQAIGAEYTFSDGQQRRTGALGDIGCTSFYPSKNLGAYGDGGAINTDSDELAARLRMVANHGQNRQYYHDVVGCNSRLDSIQAAVLNCKLTRLDDYNARRRTAARYYDEQLAGIDGLLTPARLPASTHVYHQYTLRIAGGRREALQQHLREAGVPSMIYYPVPLYDQDAFRGTAANAVDFLPVTDALCREVLSLPMHSELTEDTLAYVCQTVRAFFTT
ncbi:UDP-2-acetamido-2-deoxy-3-oxo-D-glucuronate aminotransferase [Neolewinella maritima]|uniref:UDP-2-acetamido-2-deoxy-3-oxo-D-glucuronate aminotransferase n=1 Tax=Neolewinella maritima TaxID=1383882 RepID=A0ABM9B5B4_9BACT|nr:DegT/DnrJ/EryC1/StrS family aminotransferase [Neolewinella maritima]CAH1002367.1 UDP-2-acetamido-2-deoxy-3-oxo-D-glucuronate aminotransferase [Neolewinella maritima]